tara:strand:+ start:138 stop:596 length:459 start_codon:yes stop_codon:yes gene_type:complete
MLYIKQKRLYFIFISLIIFSLDQLTKYIIITNYDSFNNVNLILFNFKYVKNYGAAFNILAGSRIFLSSVSLLISTTLFYLILFDKIKTNIELYSFSFILGGTLGNGIDRIINGYVFDFINLTFINFPVFNIADIFINIGFFLILYFLVKYKK